MDMFINRRKIGEGQFGKVFYAYDTVNNREVAMKCIERNGKTKFEIQKFVSEIQISKKLSHKNLVQFYGCYKSKKYYILVYEYCNCGNLSEYMKYIQKEKNLVEKEKKINFIATQIKDALIYLNSQQIIHRDIKPDNIFIHKINDELIIKLGDFGLSRLYDIQDINDIGTFKINATLCGTQIYMAPEIILGKSVSIKSDLWSFGVIMYQMMYNSHPYKTSSFKDLIISIKNPITYNFNLKYSTECIELLQSLLVFELENRITFENFASNSWLNGNIFYSCITCENSKIFETQDTESASTNIIVVQKSLPLILRDSNEKIFDEYIIIENSSDIPKYEEIYHWFFMKKILNFL